SGVTDLAAQALTDPYLAQVVVAGLMTIYRSDEEIANAAEGEAATEAPVENAVATGEALPADATATEGAPDGVAPLEGTTPPDGVAPLDGEAPANGAVPAAGAAPADGTVPADGAAPADGALAPDAAAPASETPADTEGAVAAEAVDGAEPAPAGEAAPTTPQ